MSPRSVSSMTTSPVAPGALAPATCPSHDSPPSPFPLSPLPPVASAKPAHHDASVRHSLDRSMTHAGHGRMSSARLGPELGQAGETVPNSMFFLGVSACCSGPGIVGKRVRATR